MSVSFAGVSRSPSAATPAAAVLADPVIVSRSSVHAQATAHASVPIPAASPAAPVLATPAVSPIVQTVEHRLRESSYYYLRSIRCAFESGVITLRGRVPTFYLKQTVQAIVEKIEGVEQVVNLVEVFDSRQAPVSRMRPAS